MDGSRTPLDGKRLKMYIMSMREVVDFYKQHKGGKTKCRRERMKPDSRESLMYKGIERVWESERVRQNAETKCNIGFTFALRLRCV